MLTQDRYGWTPGWIDKIAWSDFEHGRQASMAHWGGGQDARSKSIAVAMDWGKPKFRRIWTSQGRDRTRAGNKLYFWFCSQSHHSTNINHWLYRGPSPTGVICRLTLSSTNKLKEFTIVAYPWWSWKSDKSRHLAVQAYPGVRRTREIWPGNNWYWVVQIVIF